MDFSRWTSNVVYIDTLKKYYESYIQQFPDEYKLVIEKVLSNLDYYDQDCIDKICNDYLSKMHDATFEKSKFITTILDNKVHNSSIFYCLINSRFGGIENLFPFEYYHKKNMDVHRFVVCDDYTGSGNTMLKVVDQISKMCIADENKIINVAFFPAICCKEAIENINKTMNSSYPKINYTIYSIVNRENGYLTKKNIFTQEELHVIDLINEYCCIPEKYHYGYGKSEELLSMYYGTPNNTIGFLWHKSKSNIVKPFFNRRYEGIWFNDNGKFIINYKKDRSFVEKTIQELFYERSINMFDKKILIYKLLGYDDNVLNNLFSLNDVVKSKANLVNRKYLKEDMTKGVKVSEKLIERINRYKLNLDDSPQSNIEMNLIALK